MAPDLNEEVEVLVQDADVITVPIEVMPEHFGAHWKFPHLLRCQFFMFSQMAKPAGLMTMQPLTCV